MVYDGTNSIRVNGQHRRVRKGMTVADHVDKARFQAQLAPVYADFAKRFGQENIDRIRNYH